MKCSQVFSFKSVPTKGPMFWHFGIDPTGSSKTHHWGMMAWKHRGSFVAQMCGNPSLVLRVKNMRRVAKQVPNPGTFSDISNVNLDLYTGLHVCYIPLKSF